MSSRESEMYLVKTWGCTLHILLRDSEFYLLDLLIIHLHEHNNQSKKKINGKLELK